MQSFRNILFVSDGIRDETAGLQQALSLARSNEAALTAVVFCPECPDTLARYRDLYEASLQEQAVRAIDSVRGALGHDDRSMPVAVHVDSGSTPAVRIIRRVIRGAYDLVVKQAEPREDRKGFKAFDMELLRKCPCPVWLCRPISAHREEIRVAVAIDPESQEPTGHDLGSRLLTLSRSLADACSGALDIISCWECVFEGYLRHNPWGKVPEAEVHKAIEEVRARHRGALDALIEESRIGGTYRVHHLRGRPDALVPSFVEEHGVDILVMGTVARTGIAGFVIGNTAENVMQELRCSLLALKPSGFVSPVKAY